MSVGKVGEGCQLGRWGVVSQGGGGGVSVGEGGYGESELMSQCMTCICSLHSLGVISMKL